MVWAWLTFFKDRVRLVTGYGEEVQISGEENLEHTNRTRTEEEIGQGFKVCIKPLSLRLYLPPPIFGAQMSPKEINLEHTIKPMTIYVLY
ncbi:hypothetical protein J1N35_040119 [Gossypium stocksii]|uniref:Uncharacterized protein n=1 Tax=Gossypium stocksii TaxID=47602 RepID=A0A9D3UCZ8_9ROSI|nr:hypothetical protein J1N35_040119 [Gossypium stocksii]